MNQRLRAMQLDRPGSPLHAVDRPLPDPGRGEIRLRIAACGVCRTDLHVADGDIHGPLPIIPGHEIVGYVDAIGPEVAGITIGDRLGVPWLARTCGTCIYCREGRENLCDNPTFSGFTRDGGFASHCVADARFCLSIPAQFDDVHAAPLLCAGLIGYRALKFAEGAAEIGIYGFGAAAHIITQIAVHQGRRVHAFTRPGDLKAQQFAVDLGCASAQGSDRPPPAALDAAILFAPVGELVPVALKAVRKGARVICAGIHMSDIPSFPYADLWEERALLSVANLTRADGAEFMRLAAEIPLHIAVSTVPLGDANAALDGLRRGAVSGAYVLVP
jgi:propanol-preferring alcohol dehydrogenase